MKANTYDRKKINAPEKDRSLYISQYDEQGGFMLIERVRQFDHWDESRVILNRSEILKLAAYVQE